MRAAVRDRYGPPEVVRVEEVQRPDPVADQVLVRVAAAAANRADLDALLPKPGFLRLFFGIRKPRSARLGLDVAGVVEAVGPDVKALRIGDRVFADLFTANSGAFAEYVAAREQLFARIPDEMTFETAAALPHAGVLGIQGLRLRDGRTPRPGDRVFIDGASGNVGPFAVQVAKALGAEVTAVARGSKLDFVRSLGADHVIDYLTVDYTKAGLRYDWIVDMDSHHSYVSIPRALTPGGVYVTLGGGTRALFASLLIAPLLSMLTRKRLGLLLWWKPFDKADVATLLGLIAAGKVAPQIDRRFGLDQVVDALRYVNDGHARGKVLVIP
jgi:NADPH:quinone reductase-like Zn-dependent oxidoreductase